MALTDVQLKTLTELNKRGSRFTGSRRYNFLTIWRELDDNGYGLDPVAKKRLMAEKAAIATHADIVEQIAASADQMVKQSATKGQPIGFEQAVRQIVAQTPGVSFAERAEQTLRDRFRALQYKEDDLNQRTANLITALQASEGLTLQEASRRVWEQINAQSQ